MEKFINAGLLFFVLLFFFGCGPRYEIELVEKDSQVDVMVNDQLMTTYRYGRHLSKPVLHPVYAPSGEVVTRWYPFKEIEGESHDHSHHTGVYFTYGSAGEVNGNSFWWNRHDLPPLTKDVKVPQIRQVELLEMEEGGGYARIKARYHWVDSIEKPILEEERLMEFYVLENEYTIDFTIHLSALDETVTFEDTKEGMFAIRVADWLAPNPKSELSDGTGVYLNAEGNKEEKGIWGKRSAWVRLEGEKEGKKIGVTIFHHPESVNYPAYWHARDYGCFAANPIGRFAYQKGTGVEDPRHRTYTLKPGETGLFKFRLLVYEDPRSKEQLDQEFEEFSRR